MLSRMRSKLILNIFLHILTIYICIYMLTFLFDFGLVPIYFIYIYICKSIYVVMSCDGEAGECWDPPDCDETERKVIKPGKCCEECVPKACPKDDGQCIGCKTCPYGFNDGCNDIVCDANGIKTKLTNNVCEKLGPPFCLPSCVENSCANVTQICIESNQVLMTPPGECCPVCVSSMILLYIWIYVHIY